VRRGGKKEYGAFPSLGGKGKEGEKEPCLFLRRERLKKEGKKKKEGSFFSARRGRRRGEVVDLALKTGVWWGGGKKEPALGKSVNISPVTRKKDRRTRRPKLGRDGVRRCKEKGLR